MHSKSKMEKDIMKIRKIREGMPPRSHFEITNNACDFLWNDLALEIKKL